MSHFGLFYVLSEFYSLGWRSLKFIWKPYEQIFRLLFQVLRLRNANITIANMNKISIRISVFLWNSSHWESIIDADTLFTLHIIKQGWDIKKFLPQFVYCIDVPMTWSWQNEKKGRRKQNNVFIQSTIFVECIVPAGFVLYSVPDFACTVLPWVSRIFIYGYCLAYIW